MVFVRQRLGHDRVLVQHVVSADGRVFHNLEVAEGRSGGETEKTVAVRQQRERTEDEKPADD